VAIVSASGMHSRRTVLRILAAAVAPMMPALAHGQSPQPIRLNVPFSPGTGPDLLARILSEELRRRWNQPVIVENKPGASGNIGTQVAARTAPDGQNLLVTVNTFVMNASLYPTLPYDPEKDFVPIVEIATGALALVVHPTLGVSTLAELIALARSKPGEINYASPGRGTPQHLAMELFKLTAQINLTHIPYSGSAGAVKDLAGGHVSAMFLPVHTALPLAETGQPKTDAAGDKCADARRTRRHRLRRRFVVWRACSSQHAERDRRSLQCGVQRDTRGAERSDASRQAGLDRARRPVATPGRPDRQGSSAVGESRQGCADHRGVVDRIDRDEAQAGKPALSRPVSWRARSTSCL
jgi:tripartite-type tricarboxylate transporter receptor subunit TctC